VLASGGSNITSAPTVVYGQQEFGNTATDDPPVGGDFNGCSSWWVLDVTAGDKLTVNWQSVSKTNSVAAFDASLFSVGINDFNVSNNAVVHAQLKGNGYGQLLYTAPRTGVMPLQSSNYTCSNGGGPYDFTAYVRHALVLGIRTRASRRSHTTSFIVSVHNPDGALISNPALRAALQHRAGGKWQTLQTVAQPFNLTIKWKPAQRGKPQTIRVSMSGPSYQTTTKSVTVQAQ